MKTLTTLILSVLFLVGAVSSALAATDGTVGETSEATSDISLTVNNLVKISGIADWAIGTYTGPSSLTLTKQERCVVAGNDDSTPSYQVTIESDTGAFKLDRTAGNADDIAFTVAWNDEAADGGTAVEHGVALTGQTGIHTLLATATENANLRIVVTESDIEGAQSGTYEATLSVEIAPE